MNVSRSGIDSFVPYSFFRNEQLNHRQELCYFFLYMMYFKL